MKSSGHQRVEKKCLFACQAMRTNILPSSFLYISQGPHAPPAWLLDISTRRDSRALWGTFMSPWQQQDAARRLVSIHIPNTSWTSGRNELYQVALRAQRERGYRESYIIFCDQDAGPLQFAPLLHPGCCEKPGSLCNVQPTISASESPVDYFHRMLSTETPAVASVRQLLRGAVRNTCALRACSADQDAVLQAFHALASPLLLPYSAELDGASIWNSQAIMIETVDLLFRHDAVQYNHLGVPSNEHRPENATGMPRYRRSRESVKVRYENGRDTEVIAHLRAALPSRLAARLDRGGFIGRRGRCQARHNLTCLPFEGIGDVHSRPCPDNFQGWQQRVPELAAALLTRTSKS